MDLLDEEVFAVILALIVVGSIFTAIYEVRGEEKFVALGVLNENCQIGDYPKNVQANTNITLCIYIYNYMDKPEAFNIMIKLGNISLIPTNTTPSPAQVLWNKIVILNHGEEAYINASITLPHNIDYLGKNITLIFELWIYRQGEGWIYTGRWVHLQVYVDGAT